MDGHRAVQSDLAPQLKKPRYYFDGSPFSFGEGNPTVVLTLLVLLKHYVPATLNVLKFSSTSYSFLLM